MVGILSVSVILAYRMGVFNQHLDLLDSSNHVAIYAAGSSNVEFAIEEDGKQKVLICDVKDLSEYSYCSLNILFSPQGDFEYFPQGKDFSRFERLVLSMEHIGQVLNDSIRVSFRNHDFAYAKSNDFTSLKYNSAVVLPQYQYVTTEIELDRFEVEQWWLEAYKVSNKDAELDFSNISFVEIVPHNIVAPGRYEITVNELLLTGEAFKEATMLMLILAFWAFVGATLIIQQNRSLKRLSVTDLVTETLNRRGLSDWVNEKLSTLLHAQSLCMLYIDLDDFKNVNDGFGHIAGDELLKALCIRVEKLLASHKPTISYKFARLSGDEFAIVLRNVSPSVSTGLAQTILDTISAPFNLSTCTVKISASIGICEAYKSMSSFEELLSNADMAMYYSKKRGKNSFTLFEKSFAEANKKQKIIAEKLKHALKEEGFKLVFMPIVSCNDSSIERVEVLLRVKQGYLDGVGPDIFIPIAEQYNLIYDIDMWVVENALRAYSVNKAVFEASKTILCINISAIELKNDRFIEHFSALVKQYDIDTLAIELEITETCLIDIDGQSICILEALQEMGVKISLDDFGTGYTAFNQLTHYPVDCLKIDKSFIDGLLEDNETKITVISVILHIAKVLKLQTVAEGIETQEQFNAVKAMGCDMAQGYLISKPIPIDMLLAKLHSQTVKKPS